MQYDSKIIENIALSEL